MRSRDHIGFVLSVKKPNCETYSVCGASFPLQKDSINIIALFLKYEQLPACLALAFFMHRLPLRPPAWRDLPGVQELVRTPEANFKKSAVYIHTPPFSFC